MKRIILTSIIVISSIVLMAQEKDYYYKISISGVTDSVSAKNALPELKLIFGTEPVFNDEFDIFEVNSKYSILESSMKHVLKDLSYELTLFERKELIGVKHIEK